jgi:anti-sigma factor RsiW
VTAARRSDAHQEYEELAAGHALGALEPEDEQRFLAHLPGCARCERELAEHLDTATLLAHAAEPLDLPDGMLDRLREQVRADARPGGPVPVAPVSVLDAARERRRMLALPRDPRSLTAAAAALVLVLGLAGWNATLQRANSQQEQRSEELTLAVQAMTGQPSRSVPLRGAGNRVAAVAVLAQDQVSLVVDGLQANDAATTSYVLWEKGRLGDVRAVGTFDVREGHLEIVRNLPLHHGADGVSVLAVTHEQGNTAPDQPTQDPVAAATVSAA